MTLPWKKGPPPEGEAGEWVGMEPTDTDRVSAYVERYFQRSGETEFPTVRQVARALGIRQGAVELAVDGDPDANLQLTSHGSGSPLGDFFVETIDAPEALAPPSPQEGGDTAEAKLRAFARDVMGEWPRECDLDGFQIQDLAVKHGLIAPVEVTEPCQPEGCFCEEFHGDFEGGVTCYRKTELLLPGEGT